MLVVMIVLYVILAVVAIGCVDAAKKETARVKNECSLRIEDMKKQMIGEKNTLIYRASVQEVPIESLNVAVKLPVEHGDIDPWDLVDKNDLLEMMRQRAIVDVQEEPWDRTIYTRFKWFINKHSKLEERDSFFGKS